jgi:hypothetical protein
MTSNFNSVINNVTQAAYTITVPCYTSLHYFQAEKRLQRLAKDRNALPAEKTALTKLVAALDAGAAARTVRKLRCSCYFCFC